MSFRSTYYWERLTDGGEEGQCGWLQDRVGLSWQVVPAQRSGVSFPVMLSDSFRAAVEAGGVHQATELFHPDVVFRSPVVFKPYRGRDQVLKVLQAAERVLGLGGQFRYVHQLEDPRERVAILEFATEVDGRQVEGIDKLSFDEEGLVIELKVMLRPASGLQAVGAKMAQEFAQHGVALPS